MIKKLVVLLGAVLLVTLQGCGGNAEILNKLTGTFEYEEDFTDEVMDFIAVTDGDDVNISTGDLEFTLTGTLSISEDGLFSFSYDSDDVKKWMETARSEENDLLEAYIEGLEEKIATGMDMSIDDFQNKYEAVDYSELYEKIYGETFDSVLDRQFDELEDNLIEAVESMKDSGSVNAGRKEIRFISDIKDGAFLASYDEENDTVTLNPDTEQEIILNRVN